MSLDNLDGRMLLGDAMGVMAGMAWGATTVVVRGSRLSEAPATLTLFYQLIVGFVGLLLIALFSGQISHVSLTPVAVASVLFQGGRANPAAIALAVETASDQGWRRPLLAWLGRMAELFALQPQRPWLPRLSRLRQVAWGEVRWTPSVGQ